MRSTEGLFNDSHWEIRIPNARIESLQEDYKSVIHAKPRTHVFYGTACPGSHRRLSLTHYLVGALTPSHFLLASHLFVHSIDETVLFFLQISLPDDLSTLHEDTERQVREFFESLEIQVEAAFVDALSLAAYSAPPLSQQNTMYKSPNGRPASTQLVDKRTSATGSPGPYGGRPGSVYDQGRIESTILYSYTYNPSESGKQPEIRPINGLWTAIFPFYVPVCKASSRLVITMLFWRRSKQRELTAICSSSSLHEQLLSALKLPTPC